MRTVTTLILAVMLAAGAHAQQRFATPEAAVEALKTLAAANDESALPTLFGPLAPKLMATAEDEQRAETLRLLNLLIEERWMLAPRDAGGRILRLGLEGWPFPVPLVESEGSWSFDTEEGLEEIADRRVGENELIAIETCYRLVDAQEDYRLRDPDGDGVREYTSLVTSTEGKVDGLYWEVEDNEEPSPLQAALKEAWKYAEDRTAGTPWFGYRFRLLKGQGPSAPGGALSYEVGGRQLAGWAVVAYPAQYGESGVMTLLCNQNGVIYEKDLGPDTAAQAEAMTVFDPGEGWEITTERM